MEVKPAVVEVPNDQPVPDNVRLMTADEQAYFKALDITETERARRLCQIVQGRIDQSLKAGDGKAVRQFRKLLKSAKAKHRAVVKGKFKPALN